MTSYENLIRNLTALNRIVQALNKAMDVSQALDSALVRLVDLMGLEAGWIFLKDSGSQSRWAGKGYVLAAHYNLPPAMATSKARPWKGTCDCQSLCNRDKLQGAYNEVWCSRLLNSHGDRHNLAVHATTPLRSGNQVLGILNVAAPDWGTFSEESLVLLSNVGIQMGVALERARLFGLLKEQRYLEQSTLLDFSNQLLSHRNLDDLLSYFATEVRHILHVDGCAVLLQGETPDTLAFHTTSGWYGNPQIEIGDIAINRPDGTGLVLYEDHPLQIKDIQQNNQSITFPEWLLQEDFQGHIVLPLIAENEQIGALLVNMRNPRLLDDNELRFLQLMANQAAIAIENARLHQEEVKRQRMEEELAVAHQIQQTLLPETNPDIPNWEFATFYHSARLVGGDYYDFFELPGNRSDWGIVIGDVSGKGVPAALFMAMCRSIIRTKAMSGPKPAVVLNRANRLIMKDSRTGLFLTTFYAILNPATASLTYTNAGHNWPLWYQAETSNIEELSTIGVVLGVFEPIKLEQKEITMAANDVLVCYTDGITESMNTNRQLFGETRLKEVIQTNGHKSAEEILQAIVDAVNHFTADTPQNDDLTLVIIKYMPPKTVL